MNFQEIMKQNINNILISELHASSSYLERLFQVIVNLTELHQDKVIRELSLKLYQDSLTILEKSLFSPKLTWNTPEVISVSQSRLNIKKINQVFTSLLQLDINNKEIEQIVVNYINTLYHYSHQIHAYCEHHSHVNIEFPRINLLEVEDDSEQIKKFQLPLEKVQIIDDSSSISSLGTQREKKYEVLLQEGHELIFHKKYQEGLKKFISAKSFQETSEILTLIGWAYSLLDNFEKAKSFCLKAIKQDKDYGPPYNDLGTYLLREGQVNESLKWFELAKRSLIYQNREYPYINSGRAYIAKKDYAKALESFKKALSIAPYQKDLKDIILKLEKSLTKATQLFDTSNVPSPTSGI